MGSARCYRYSLLNHARFWVGRFQLGFRGVVVVNDNYFGHGALLHTYMSIMLRSNFFTFVAVIGATSGHVRFVLLAKSCKELII
jgi:hypothetical protein